MKNEKLPQVIHEAKRIGNTFLDFFHGILKKHDLGNLPVAGRLFSLAKAILSERELLLIRDLGRFQRAFDDMPEDEKEHFIRRLNNEPDFEEKVARILIDLPLLDDGEKVNWLVNFMRAYTAELIDSYKLDCFRYTLRNSLVQDLKVLIAYVEAKEKDSEYNWVGHIDQLALQRLASAGLLTGPTTAFSSVLFGVDEYGKSFVKFGIGENK
jgi:hypothetical protein